MTVSKSQQKAVHKYVKANYDRMELTMHKGKKALIQEAAKESNRSVNQYVNACVDARLERKLRRKLEKYDYRLIKSRRRTPPSPEERAEFSGLGLSDMGGYRITNSGGSTIEGGDFELSITDVNNWIKDALPDVD